MNLRNDVTLPLRAAHVWLAAAALAASGAAEAKSFQLFDGAVEGSFDTTLGYGLQLRTEKMDPSLTIPHPSRWAQGDTEASLLKGNNQYGNRYLFNKKWDVFSNLVKASHDLQLNGQGWSAFVRGNYFYDFAMAAEKDSLPDAAENRAVQHGDITDAYFLTRFGSTDQFTVRLGKQVISWGENTFIGGSLNDINTVDISKLRQPGIELKDALTGTPAAYFSWQMNESLSLESFVLFSFHELKLDPYGSFFGTQDAIVDGGGFANAMIDPPGPLGPFPICAAPDGGTCHFALGAIPVTRAGDHLPSASGQYGLALRYYAPGLGNGFDFGLYYQRLNDHNPQLSSYAGATVNGLPQPGRFFVDYAKDVERYGLSFNTTVGSWALGGEYSYRRNAPIQGTDFLVVAATGRDLSGKVYAPGEKYVGFQDYKRHQLQLTAQRLWGPMPMLLGADQWNTIGEIAYGWIDDMPGVDLDGHEKGPAYTNQQLAAAAIAGGGFLRFDDVTPHFWGLQARSTLTYNNILFNRINMDFNTAFRWDVDGVSPEFGGAQLFVGGRKQLSLGVTFDYALNWKVGITQTFAFGGEDHWRPNGTRVVNNTDRDFLSVDVSYSF